MPIPTPLLFELCNQNNPTEITAVLQETDR